MALKEQSIFHSIVRLSTWYHIKFGEKSLYESLNNKPEKPQVFQIIQMFLQNITFLTALIWNEQCLWQFTLCPLSTKQLWSTNKKTLNYLRGKTNLVFLASYDIYSRKVVSNEFLNKTGKGRAERIKGRGKLSRVLHMT